MKLRTTLLFILFSISVFSQSSDITIGDTKKIQGVSAKHYQFDQQIETIFADKRSNTLTVGFRNKGNMLVSGDKTGEFVQYNTEKNEINFKKKVSFDGFSYFNIGEYIIMEKGIRDYFLSSTDSGYNWVVDAKISHVDWRNNIAIGYKYESLTQLSKVLTGYDIATGKIVWQRELPALKRINEAIYLNDTTGLLVSNGLHTVHTSSGKGWSTRKLGGTEKEESFMMICLLRNVISFSGIMS